MQADIAVPKPTASTKLPETVAADAPVLAPTEALVSVRVKSIPSGAEIYLAGRKLGTTPLDVDLPSGTHELIARFDGWPETRETLVLNEGQSKASTELHLMPPGLVPGSEEIPPPQNSHPHRPLASPSRAPVTERRAIPVAPAIPVEPFVDDATRAPAAAPTVRPEPEIRRALPPLTPFDPDGTLGTHDATKPPAPDASPAGD